MTGITYRDAGVDLDAGALIKNSLIKLVSETHTPTVFSMPGFFAGGIDAPGSPDTLLMASTDSVGTKVRLAAAVGSFRGLGADIVNHCVNDILTTGARPLFFLDYIGIDEADERRIVEVVEGLRDACKVANCAIIGGETAFLPGVYNTGDLDLVGFIVGIVAKDKLLNPRATVQPGDTLIGVPSDGIHTNGASLVRKVFNVDDDSSALNETPEGFSQTLGETLITPHRSYLGPLASVMVDIRGMAHITGGGISENMSRILPDDIVAAVHTSTWEVPLLFRYIQSRGGVTDDEMFRVFNMGVGMILVVAPDREQAVLAAVDGAWRIGSVAQNTNGDSVRVIIE